MRNTADTALYINFFVIEEVSIVIKRTLNKFQFKANNIFLAGTAADILNMTEGNNN